jgi:hypothetical protein
VPDLDTDLSRETDQVLDATLTRLYAQHLAGDRDERAVVHQCIEMVLVEMGRRVDVWLANRG